MCKFPMNPISLGSYVPNCVRPFSKIHMNDEQLEETKKKKSWKKKQFASKFTDSFIQMGICMNAVDENIASSYEKKPRPN